MIDIDKAWGGKKQKRAILSVGVVNFRKNSWKAPSEQVILSKSLKEVIVPALQVCKKKNISGRGKGQWKSMCEWCGEKFISLD